MEKLEQLLIGSMLGDGYLEKQSKPTKNSRLSIAHSSKQMEYCKYKHSILKEFELAGKLCYNKIINKRYKEGFIEEYRFRSKASPIFSQYRALFYPKNKSKIVHKSTVRNIDAFGLAIWFMDDGAKTISGYLLCTQSFTLSDITFLRKLLKSKFNLDTTCQPGSNMIYIKSKSVKVFNELIEPHVITSMKYKLHTCPE